MQFSISHFVTSSLQPKKKAKSNCFTSSTTAGPFDRNLNVALPVPSVSEFLEDAFLLWRGAIASINELTSLKNHF